MGSEQPPWKTAIYDERLHLKTLDQLSPTPRPTGRQEGKVTNAQMSRGSQGQRPGSGILSKSKRNVYYHWR